MKELTSDIWNSFDRNTRSVCTELYKRYAYHMLMPREHEADNIRASTDGRRRKTIRKTISQYVPLIIDDDFLRPLDIHDLNVVAPFIQTCRINFPDVHDLHNNQLRSIVSFFSSKMNSTDRGGLTSSFHCNGFSNSHIMDILKHKNEYYITHVNHNTYVISVDKFNQYLEQIKRNDTQNALNYEDNIGDYLSSLGIADGKRLMQLLNNRGLGSEMKFASPNSPSGFDALNEETIRERIKNIGVTLKQLDNDLTLLQFADIVLKRKGGADHIHEGFVNKVDELISNTYSGIKGHHPVV